MVAYVIASNIIHDPDTYRKYMAQTPAFVEKHGGRFLTRGTDVITLEGEEFEGRMVILEFPDRAHVDAFFGDPDYQEAAKLRFESSKSTVVVQEGYN